jgi:hypothetical protein|mmetsp:Transcript_77817/g.130644  ORF Transcript_77817/g.130644 Transcript_77817/m.130644 type:complete len:90 (+) Transcript_77817:374-643(+)
MRKENVGEELYIENALLFCWVDIRWGGGVLYKGRRMHIRAVDVQGHTQHSSPAAASDRALFTSKRTSAETARKTVVTHNEIKVVVNKPL